MGTWDMLSADALVGDNRFVDFLGYHLQATGETEDQVAFAALIRETAKFCLKPGTDALFVPASEWDGKRSLLPSDLHADAFRALATAFTSCPHGDLKGRIGEVLWNCAKHTAEFKKERYGWVTGTVTAFQALVEQTLADDPANRVHINMAFMRLRRAAMLVREVANPALAKAFGSWLDGLRTTHAKRADATVLVDMLAIELEFHWISPAACFAQARAMGMQQLEVGNHSAASDCFGLALNAAQKTNDPAQVKAAHLDCASARIALAQAYEAASPDAVAPAAHAYQQALVSLRACGADKSMTDPVQQHLLRLNKRLCESAGTFSVPFDMTDLAKEMGQRFEQASLQESLHFFLFRLDRPKGYRESRERLMRHQRNSVVMSLMPIAKMSGDGRVEGVAGPIGQSDDEGLGRLFHEVAQRQDLTGMMLRVARWTFLEHHPIDLRLCEELVNLSPVVPDDRKASVARGILRGWQGEWGDALHLLIPQVENFLRAHLLRAGVVVTKSNPLKQHYIDLGEMLTEHQELLAAAFGEGSILALRAACTENLGHNRRNDLSHGLIPDAEMGSVADIYLWWLITRMVLWSVFHDHAPDAEHSTVEPSASAATSAAVGTEPIPPQPSPDAAPSPKAP